MSSMQRVMLDSIRRSTELIVTALIEKKLETQGVSEPAEAAQQIARGILKGNHGTYSIDNGQYHDIALDFTDEDEKFLSDNYDCLIKGIPDMIKSLAEETAQSALKSSRQSWNEYRGYAFGEVSAFRYNIRLRWGKGLEALEFLLTISREVGEEFLSRASRSKSKRNLALRDTLLRLHARCCQIMAEIIALLENGFADGAMARWRTLHEVTIVATVLAEAGEEVALRYLEHEAVEAKRAMGGFLKSHGGLGWKPPSKREVRAVEKAFEEVKKKYGEDFCTDYGWATGIVGKRRPKFSDLEMIAGRAMMRSHYKMASYNVHAGVKGITFRLGMLDQGGTLLAGASNAGLEEPAHNAAISLVQATLPLLGSNRKLDDTVKLLVLQKVQDEAVSEFIRAGRRLRSDDARLMSGLIADMPDK